MFDSKDLESYRYAQMQSSIANKTSGSNFSNTGTGKINLSNKFASLREKLIIIEEELRQLNADTRVCIFTTIGVLTFC